MEVPSIAIQRSVILQKLEHRLDDAEIGEEWHIIGTKWYSSWKAHVNWGTDSSDEGGPSPGPIYNNGLEKRFSTKLKEDKAVLRPDASEGQDYEVVNEAVFRKLEEWYTVQPDTPTFVRSVILQGGAEKTIELRPPRFGVLICDDDGEPEATLCALMCSRTTPIPDLIKLALDKCDEFDRWFERSPTRPNRLWYSEDGAQTWALLEETDEAGKILTVESLDRVMQSNNLQLMGESAKGPVIGSETEPEWKRGADESNCKQEMEAVVSSVADAGKLDDIEWRTGLKAGAFCDHLDDALKPPKWREAVVMSVSADTGSELEVHWRGFRRHSVMVARDSEALQKPFSKARDWRNQLRTDTKIELHNDKMPSGTSVIYSKVVEGKTTYFYYVSSHNEWWIGDTVAKRHGYINISKCASKNPRDISANERMEAEYWTCRWEKTRNITVTCTDYDESDPDAIPRSVTISGLPEDNDQFNKMGEWIRQEWINAEVAKIGRKSGTLNVTVVTGQKPIGYSRYYDYTTTIRGISLYGEDICEPGTHIKKMKKTSAWQQSVESEVGEQGEQGRVGLRNLGNTCFMNSMLQCLNSAPSFVEYFRDEDRFSAEVNTKNPLGTGGVLAEAYSGLVRDMWDGKYKTVAPTNLKDTLGRFAPQFAGYQQQDSMELFSFLLDNLHEDLNRITEKPYVEEKEDGGRPDDVVSSEAWEGYRKRNSSIVVDTLMGQYKSHLECPNPRCKDCRKFDPYMSIALPIPGVVSKPLSVTLFVDPSKPGITYNLQVPKSGTGRDIVSTLCEAHDETGVSVETVALYDMLQKTRAYITLYSPGTKKSTWASMSKISERDDLFAYIVGAPSQDETTGTINATVDDDDDKLNHNNNVSMYTYNRQAVSQVEGSTSAIVQVRFGIPIKTSYSSYHNFNCRPWISSIRKDSTCDQVHDWVWNTLVKPYIVDPPPAYDTDSSVQPSVTENSPDDRPYTLYITNEQSVLKDTSQPYDKRDFLKFERGDKPFRDVLALDQNLGLAVIFEEDAVFDKVRVNESVASSPKGSKGGENDDSGIITLGKSFEAFKKREQLGVMDTWYCPSCKEHVQAYKKMDLWSVPEVLTLQLKRFQYEQGAYAVNREKLDTLVDFPERLDMKEHVIGPQHEDESLDFELFAVSNHIGFGMGGGHYTAYGKHGGKWYLFNDTTVTPADWKDIVDAEAYVLFYRRIRPGDGTGNVGVTPDPSSANERGGGGGGGGDDLVSDASGVTESMDTMVI